MSEACGNCGALAARVAALQAQVDYLTRQYDMLADRYGELRSFVASIAAFGEGQIENPTMKRYDALFWMTTRLQELLVGA